MSSTRCWRPADDADDRPPRRQPVGQCRAGLGVRTERCCAPLPAESFDTALTLTPRVDRYAQVTVRCNQYTVPARFIGHRLRVKLSASAVTVYRPHHGGGPPPARGRARAPKCWIWITIWRSCCASPARCPEPPRWRRPARPRCSPPTHEAFWVAARKALGDAMRHPSRWSRCCCCTAISIAPTCSPASPPRCRSGPPAPMWSRWKPARPPKRRGVQRPPVPDDAGRGGHVVSPGRAPLGGRARR